MCDWILKSGGKNPWSRLDENQQQSQPTYDAELQNEKVAFNSLFGKENEMTRNCFGK